MKLSNIEQVSNKHKKNSIKHIMNTDICLYNKLKEMRKLAALAKRSTSGYDKKLEELRRKWPNYKWS